MTVKNDIYEFPEDDTFVSTNMDDYTTELLEGNGTTKTSSGIEDSPNLIYRTCLLFVSSVASVLFLATAVVRFSPLLGSALSLFSVLVLREWNRIYGRLLTPQLKASINYSQVLRVYKEYIPFYDMEWLFGGKYHPYYYGCTGPSINPEIDRTPDDADCRSPTKPRTNEKLRKDD